MINLEVSFTKHHMIKQWRPTLHMKIRGQMKQHDETMGKQLGLHLKRRKGEQKKEGSNRGKNLKLRTKEKTT
jgi:hypothetical protein